MSGQNNRVALVLSQFDPNKPCVVIRPAVLQNVRLCINVEIGERFPSRKLSKENILEMIRPLSRRFGQLMDYQTRFVAEKTIRPMKISTVSKKFSNIPFYCVHATPRRQYMAVRDPAL